MKRRMGFTLIELLVVIAIIALLMAILMPALRRVKKQADTVGCMANLKQWGLTFALYSDENDGKFPSGEGYQGFWWICQLDDRIQSRKKNPLWLCPSAQKPITDEAGVTTDTFNIFNAWGIYPGSTHAGLSADGIAGSYGLNGYVLSTTPSTQTFEGSRTTMNNWRTPRIGNANSVPLFIEALRFDLWPVETDAPADYEFAAWASTNHMARCAINRHDGFLNSAFCDFSARKVGLKELWTLKWHKQFNIAGPWTKAGGVQPSTWPEWIRPFKEY